VAPPAPELVGAVQCSAVQCSAVQCSGLALPHRGLQYRGYSAYSRVRCGVGGLEPRASCAAWRLGCRICAGTGPHLRRDFAASAPGLAWRWQLRRKIEVLRHSLIELEEENESMHREIC
jgi:hypothetical protein